MSDGDDNVTDLGRKKGNQNQTRKAADVLTSAQAAMAKAKTDAFQAKLKPELEKLEEAKRTVALQTEKIDTMCADFDASQASK